jgi:GDSL-like Lipase/Acylhydrolase
VLVVFVVAAPSEKKRSAPAEPMMNKVLMIGDSLSVAKFGDVMRDFLVSTCGARNVAVFASCGSSPENWLRSEPTFFTKCGYREQTPSRSVVLDRRLHLATPKIENLIATYRPDTIIVQLGTNWMDRLTTSHAPQKEAEISDILDRFIAAARGRRAVRILWIMPPDSSHFPKRVQSTVANLISAAARKDHFEPIYSRTHYVPGKTGRDGVHYNPEYSEEWARQVIVRIKRLLPMSEIYAGR